MNYLKNNINTQFYEFDFDRGQMTIINLGKDEKSIQVVQSFNRTNLRYGLELDNNQMVESNENEYRKAFQKVLIAVFPSINNAQLQITF